LYSIKLLETDLEDEYGADAGNKKENERCRGISVLGVETQSGFLLSSRKEYFYHHIQ
jgi:hypothetical protein